MAESSLAYHSVSPPVAFYVYTFIVYHIPLTRRVRFPGAAEVFRHGDAGGAAARAAGRGQMRADRQSGLRQGPVRRVHVADGLQDGQ